MFAVLLLAALPQTAAQVPAAGTPPVVVVAPKPAKDPQICRPIRDTVSRIGGGRECHTAAQWRRMGDGVDGHALDRENQDIRTQLREQPR